MEIKDLKNGAFTTSEDTISDFNFIFTYSLTLFLKSSGRSFKLAISNSAFKFLLVLIEPLAI